MDSAIRAGGKMWVITDIVPAGDRHHAGVLLQRRHHDLFLQGCRPVSTAAAIPNKIDPMVGHVDILIACTVVTTPRRKNNDLIHSSQGGSRRRHTSQRYERGSTIVTSNLPFEDWTSVLGLERLTGALLDRLTHHVHILTMNGDSYRLKQSAGRRRAAAARAEQNQATTETVDPDTSEITAP